MSHAARTENESPAEKTVERLLRADRSDTYSVAVRAQWLYRLSDAGNARPLVFPALALSNDLAFDAEEHAEPDFHKTDQPFWADEVTHKPEKPS